MFPETFPGTRGPTGNLRRGTVRTGRPGQRSRPARAGRVGRICWEGETDLTPREVLAPASGLLSGPGRPDDKLQEALRFLMKWVSPGAEVDSAILYKQADTLEIARRTLHRAKKQLRMKNHRQQYTQVRVTGISAA